MDARDVFKPTIDAEAAYIDGARFFAIAVAHCKLQHHPLGGFDVDVSPRIQEIARTWKDGLNMLRKIGNKPETKTYSVTNVAAFLSMYNLLPSKVQKILPWNKTSKTPQPLTEQETASLTLFLTSLVTTRGTRADVVAMYNVFASSPVSCSHPMLAKVKWATLPFDRISSPGMDLYLDNVWNQRIIKITSPRSLTYTFQCYSQRTGKYEVIVVNSRRVEPPLLQNDSFFEITMTASLADRVHGALMPGEVLSYTAEPGYHSTTARIKKLPIVIQGAKASGKSHIRDYLLRIMPSLVIIDSDDFGKGPYLEEHGITLEVAITSKLPPFDESLGHDDRAAEECYREALVEFQTWALQQKADVIFVHTTIEASHFHDASLYTLIPPVAPAHVLLHRPRDTTPIEQLSLGIFYAKRLTAGLAAVTGGALIDGITGLAANTQGVPSLGVSLPIKD